MTTFTEMLQSVDDCQTVLSAVLSHTQPEPGFTLIAFVDRATLQVRTSTRMRTPRPDMRVNHTGTYFTDESIHELSEVLCEVAVSLAPERGWTGTGWEIPTGDFVTVVCRDGEPEVGQDEGQFHFGWRFSNHLTNAFQGEIFSLTPTGWASLYDKFAGDIPALPASETPPHLRVVTEAEAIVNSSRAALQSACPDECLFCYVARMIGEQGCDCTLRFARAYRDSRAPRATALEKRLGAAGGFCDCEIFLNGFEPSDAAHGAWVVLAGLHGDPTEPDRGHELLPCGGVRSGSTQPCIWWQRQRRGRW